MGIKNKIINYYPKLRNKIKINYKKIINKYYYNQFKLDDIKKVFEIFSIDPKKNVIIHSSWDNFVNLKANAFEFLDYILNYFDKKSNILMLTNPYLTSTYTFLKQNPDYIFDREKTPSMMGLLTEIFRRKKKVHRSFHPTHSMAVFGPDSEKIIEDHEKELYPCGIGSPYYKLVMMDSYILGLGVDINTLTITHTVEDIFNSDIKLKLYLDDIFKVKYLDDKKKVRICKTKIYNPSTMENRNIPKLKQQFKKDNILQTHRIEGVNFYCAETKKCFDYFKNKVRSGYIPWYNQSKIKKLGR